MVVSAHRVRRRQRRRKEILEAAYHIFREVGYAAATMDLIAERADVAKGTIYLYFRSKEDLYFSLLVNGLDIVIELLQGVPVTASTRTGMLTRIAEVLCQFYKSYTDYFRLFMVMQQEDMQSRMTTDIARALNQRGTIILKLLSARIQCLIDEGRYVPVDAWRAAAVLWGAFIGIAQVTIAKEDLSSKGEDIYDIVTFCFRVLDRGFARQPAEGLLITSRARNRKKR